MDRFPHDAEARLHNRITAADIAACAMTLIGFAGAVYCVLAALGSL